MLTPNDINDFIHINKVDNGFVILQHNGLDEVSRHNWILVKENFEISHEMTELKTAAALCYEVLHALGVNTRFKHHGLRLDISVIEENTNIESN